MSTFYFCCRQGMRWSVHREHAAGSRTVTDWTGWNVRHSLLFPEGLQWGVTDSVGWLQVLPGLRLPVRVLTEVLHGHLTSKEIQKDETSVSCFDFEVVALCDLHCTWFVRSQIIWSLCEKSCYKCESPCHCCCCCCRRRQTPKLEISRSMYSHAASMLSPLPPPLH